MSETIFELDTMLDQSDMRGAITEFSNQIKESFSIMSTWKAQLEYQNIENEGIKKRTEEEINNILKLANEKINDLPIDIEKLLYFSKIIKKRGN